MMRFGLRYLSKKPTVIHISTYFTDKLDKCFSVWCLIGFAPVYLSVSYVALSCLPHLNSSSTISSRRTIRSRVSLVDNNTILDLNNLPPSQMSCWIMMSCIINPAPTKPINNTLQTQCKCIHDADRRVFFNQCGLLNNTLPFQSDTHTQCVLTIFWPLCQALLQVQWVQVVPQVQGVRGRRCHRDLPAFQARPGRRGENSLLHLNCFFFNIMNLKPWPISVTHRFIHQLYIQSNESLLEETWPAADHLITTHLDGSLISACLENWPNHTDP